MVILLLLDVLVLVNIDSISRLEVSHKVTDIVNTSPMLNVRSCDLQKQGGLVSKGGHLLPGGPVVLHLRDASGPFVTSLSTCFVSARRHYIIELHWTVVSS